VTLGPLQPLADWPQFIVVRTVARANGKTDKIPLHFNTAAAIDAHDPANWTDHATARAVADALGPDHGVGFVLTKTAGFWCVDIDNCATPAGWSPEAQELYAQLPGTVIEVSQSGRGLHLWGRGPIPEHACKNVALGLECYSDRRFIMLGSNACGEMAPSCPGLAAVVARYFPPRETAGQVPAPAAGPSDLWSGPEDDAELIRRAMASRSAAGVFGGKASFADLWTANEAALSAAFPDTQGARPYDASSADASLAQHLAFWCGKDAERIERIMRQSALVREKWDRPDYLPRTISGACAQQRDVYNDGRRLATEPAAALEAPYKPLFSVAAYGGKASLENVHDALRSPESGVRVALDTFQDRIMIASTDGNEWRQFRDVDYSRLRAEFGRRGFKPISAEIMSSAVLLTADENSFDSAKQWADSLRWDGVPRIDCALPVYYRTVDSPYTRAVGAYLFTAMAGRVLQPGCQADMVVVLVGLQGERKTSAVRVLSPRPEFFAEINLKRIDEDDLARHLRGKLIGEIAELRGLAGRDQESVKAWVTRREERWTPKYREFEVSYPRRLVLIGTTNEREFLDDPTGERRWLPVTAGTVDVEGLERDRNQLWAEGIARFNAAGIAWQAAEALARGEHQQFKIEDPWTESLRTWLDSPNPNTRQPMRTAPFTMEAVCLGVLHRSITAIERKDQHRMAKLLRTLGFERSDNVRIDGRQRKAWLPLRPSGPITG
jgi:hypothetical protein